jgi:cell division protein FtsI/penicillin-binding protein 2
MFYCENGHFAIADRVFHERTWRHGTLSVRYPQYSSNIGSIKIAEKQAGRFSQYIRKFGFGAKTESSPGRG